MKKAVNLGKGARVSLAKSDGSSLSKFSVGVGWDSIKKKSFFGFGGGETEIDLDASILSLNADKQLLDMVWFRKLISTCGSIRHSGDNQTGQGDGDDETINVDTTRLPEAVKYLVVTVNSFLGQHFDQIENAFCSVYDDKKTPLVHMNIAEKGSYTGLIMAVIERTGNEWHIKSIGKPTNGKLAADMMPDIIGEI